MVGCDVSKRHGLSKVTLSNRFLFFFVDMQPDFAYITGLPNECLYAFLQCMSRRSTKPWPDMESLLHTHTENEATTPARAISLLSLQPKLSFAKSRSDGIGAF